MSAPAFQVTQQIGENSAQGSANAGPVVSILVLIIFAAVMLFTGYVIFEEFHKDPL